MFEYALNIPTQSETPVSPDRPLLTQGFPSNIHICHFYKSKKDLLELLVPFFVEGLERGEFCLWGITDPINQETAEAALNKALNGKLETHTKTGQIEIFDVTLLYGTNTFDAIAVRDLFLNKVKASLDKGWKGFRCDGMASAIAPRNWRNYQIYEGEITRTLPQPITAFCSYDLTTLTPENVLEVVSTHQASVVKKNGHWTVIESSEHLLRKESQKKEEEFRQMADAMPHMAWMAHPNGGVFWYNRRWQDYTGLAPEQLKDNHWQLLLDPSERTQVLDFWHAAVKDGKPFEMIVSLRGADGVLLPFLTRAIPIQDETGHVFRWLGTSTDLSDLTPLLRKSANEA